MSELGLNQSSSGILRAFVTSDRFWPPEPQSLNDTGLSEALIESLICKHLAIAGTSSGRNIAQHICLPFQILEDLFASLRTRQLVVHCGSAPFNDYYYSLTEEGRRRAEALLHACAYSGPAPVLLSEYINSVAAQSVIWETDAPTDEDLTAAFDDVFVNQCLLDQLGPAVSSGAGIFLYGAPGNGKSTLAQRITKCFGSELWIPHAITEDGQIIKFFDSAFHKPIQDDENEVFTAQDFDSRWLRIHRPTVVVGGELTMDALEIRHDPNSNVSEAPLQMKSNGGCLLIDDFGRQVATPKELLNRWIIPLETRHDFLTLFNGKKIQVPFEQLIIFSTNIEPRELVDEAFLRRIPYKIEITDPDEEEFAHLFELHATRLGFEYKPDIVEYVIQNHYHPIDRAMRRCHPRDLLLQVRNLCRYRKIPLEMRPEFFDFVQRTYFAMVCNSDEEFTRSE